MNKQCQLSFSGKVGANIWLHYQWQEVFQVPIKNENSKPFFSTKDS